MKDLHIPTKYSDGEFDEKQVLEQIEIALNFMLDINQQESNKTLQKICTETFAKTRRVKGGKLKTKTRNYDIFIEI
ncbi:MAG: hypothetical protein IKB21_04115 [Clostridia bacterium]|nr:hypothetical protein [Clostridia bacterium]